MSIDDERIMLALLGSHGRPGAGCACGLRWVQTWPGGPWREGPFVWRHRGWEQRPDWVDGVSFETYDEAETWLLSHGCG